jgi:hypothetical protein
VLEYELLPLPFGLPFPLPFGLPLPFPRVEEGAHFPLPFGLPLEPLPLGLGVYGD